MSIALFTAPLAAAQEPSPLVGAGMLRSPLALARAQVASRSTSLGPTGVDWVEAVADVPRFGGTARRLLVGGQRTNLVRNPRCEGVVAGTPGTMPTNFFTTTNPGLTRTITPEVRNGVAGVRVRWAGTTSGGFLMQVGFETGAAIAAAAGQVWTASVFAQVTVDNPAVTLLQCQINENTSGGAFVTSGQQDFYATRTTFSRRAVIRTLTGGTTAAIIPLIQANNIASGTAVDFEIWTGWPQAEQAPFASSPILPAVGTPAASTRGADLVSATLASLGIGANGASTVLMSAMLPQAAVSPVIPIPTD